MILGLNANGPFWTDVADTLVTLGVKACRPDVRKYSEPIVFLQNVEEASSRYTLLPIVHTIEQLMMVPGGGYIKDVELMNEPDINDFSEKRYKHVTDAADAYVAAIRPLMLACYDRGMTPWVGSISNLDARALQFLTRVVSALPSGEDYGVSFHLYNTGMSRTLQLRRLAYCAGGRRLRCTEFGFSTYQVQHFGWFNLFKRVVTYSDERALQELQAFVFDLDVVGKCEEAYLYQIVNGDKEEHFGIANHDVLKNTWTWLVQSQIFK